MSLSDLPSVKEGNTKSLEHQGISPLTFPLKYFLLITKHHFLSNDPRGRRAFTGSSGESWMPLKKTSEELLTCDWWLNKMSFDILFFKIKIAFYLIYLHYSYTSWHYYLAVSLEIKVQIPNFSPLIRANVGPVFMDCKSLTTTQFHLVVICIISTCAVSPRCYNFCFKSGAGNFFLWRARS